MTNALDCKGAAISVHCGVHPVLHSGNYPSTYPFLVRCTDFALARG